MSKITCGFETGASGLEAETITGTASVSSAQSRSGTYAFRFNPTTTAVGWCMVRGFDTSAGTSAGIKTSAFPSNLSGADAYFRGYFWYDTKPGSASEDILHIMSDAGTSKLSLRINSSGNILVYRASTTLLATGSTALVQGTKYRIEVHSGTGGAGTPWEVRIYADDNAGTLLETLSGTGDQTASWFAGVWLGKRNNFNGQTMDCWWDDVCLSQDDWIGPGRSRLLLANAAGDSNTFASGTFADADDNPHDSDTTFLASANGAGAVGQEFLLNMQNFADISVGGVKSVAVVQTCIVRKSVAGTITGTTKIKSGATVDHGTGAGTQGTVYGASWDAFTTDPNTAAAWTKNAVNTVQVGYTITTSDNTTRVTAVYALVDYQDGQEVNVHPIGIGKRPGKGGNFTPALGNFVVPSPIGHWPEPYPAPGSLGGAALAVGEYWHAGNWTEAPLEGHGWALTTNLDDGSAADTTTRETGNASITVMHVVASTTIATWDWMCKWQGSFTPTSIQYWTGSAWANMTPTINQPLDHAGYTDEAIISTYSGVPAATAFRAVFTEGDTSGGGMSVSDSRLSA